MRLVVDTNILFTYFWKGSVLKKICDARKVELFTPELALKELDKYAGDIARRTSISSDEFSNMRKDMLSNFVVIDRKDYSEFFEEAYPLLSQLPEKDRNELFEDLDFIATSMMLCCPLWSNDKLIGKQRGIVVLNTADLVSLLDID